MDRQRQCVLWILFAGLLFFFTVAFSVAQFLRDQCHPQATPSGKRAVVVLTRGYPTLDGYHTLLERTRALARLEWTRDYDHIIFHEGNITPAHQAYVTDETGVQITFVDVGDSFAKNKATLHRGGHGCKHYGASAGYKCMCAFWYIDFVTYVSQYDAVLRVDEDCFVHASSRQDPAPASGTLIASPLVYEAMDNDYVIHGLVPLAERLSEQMKLPPLRRWRSPYTNVLWVSIPFISSDRVQNIVRHVEQTNCIMTNRWGDMPLWGMTAALLGVPLTYLQLAYTHGSHGNKKILPNATGKSVEARVPDELENWPTEGWWDGEA